jgi:hypothetical protein
MNISTRPKLGVSDLLNPRAAAHGCNVRVEMSLEEQRTMVAPLGAQSRMAQRPALLRDIQLAKTTI